MTLLPRISARPRILALIMAGCVLAVLLASFVPLSLAGEALIERQQRLVAETARDYFVAFEREEGLNAMVGALDHRSRLEVGAFSYAAFDASGRLLGGDNLLPYDALPGKGFHTVRVKDRSYKVLVQPLAGGGAMAIFEDLSDRAEFRFAVLGSTFGALVIGLLVATAAGFWLQRILVSRAEGLAIAAERIAAGDLSARAPTETSGDVFDELGRSVNAMLVRIETLLADLRLVTDSLAHDLRLPLARLRTALARASDPDQEESVRLAETDRAFQITDEILATLTSLVDIARAESGLSRESMSLVDLNAVVEEMVELFGPVMEDANQGLTLQLPPSPIQITGQALLLRQALGNLLHNAARFAGEGAQVSVRLEEDGGLARIVVTDNGPGVPSEMREKVLQQFVRLDSARATPGSGLGLAIAAACAKLHGGGIWIEDAQPGARVILELRVDDQG